MLLALIVFSPSFNWLDGKYVIFPFPSQLLWVFLTFERFFFNANCIFEDEKEWRRTSKKIQLHSIFLREKSFFQISFNPVLYTAKYNRLHFLFWKPTWETLCWFLKAGFTSEYKWRVPIGQSAHFYTVSAKINAGRYSAFLMKSERVACVRHTAHTFDVNSDEENDI